MRDRGTRLKTTVTPPGDRLNSVRSKLNTDSYFCSEKPAHLRREAADSARPLERLSNSTSATPRFYIRNYHQEERSIRGSSSSLNSGRLTALVQATFVRRATNAVAARLGRRAGRSAAAALPPIADEWRRARPAALTTAGGKGKVSTATPAFIRAERPRAALIHIATRLAVSATSDAADPPRIGFLRIGRLRLDPKRPNEASR